MRAPRLLPMMRAALLGLGVLLGAQGLTGPMALAQAQDATLIADRIEARPDGQLIATGNVEVFYQGRRLKAERIVYDRDGDNLVLTGPISLSDGEAVLLLADAAELDSDLRNGLLRSARLVLDQQMQIAANEIHRVEGRYSQAVRTVASSCEVCAENPVPLWQIRASRIIHDQETQQLYFENATLQVAGVPVFYLPRLRLPDPTLRRSAGFLVPALRSTDRLGFGITTPYFLPLGTQADLTILPTFTARSSNTFGAIYRHAFQAGEVVLDFALTDDQLAPDYRGYARLIGRFDMQRGFELNFDIEDVTDAGYFRDYGFPETDRIDSEISVSRVRRDELIEARAIYFTSFRVGENNDTLTRLVGDVEYIRRLTPPALGGTLEYRLSAHGHQRPSNVDTIGRDMSRVGLEADWRRSWLSSFGLVTTGMLGVSADYHRIGQDSTRQPEASRVIPRAALEFRLPMARSTAQSTQLLEPVVQLVWSGPDPRVVPNEDSQLTEFDEANLFDLNRFTGRDRVEEGARANIGLTWTRHAISGWKLGATVGRVASLTPNPDFAPSSGFDGTLSDWLTTVRLDLPNGLRVITRAQTEPNFQVNKAALRVGWMTDQLDLSGTYTWLRPDAAVGRPFETSELALNSEYTFNNDWTAGLDWQYDLTADSTRAAGLGLGYQTECVTIGLSLSRSFTASANVQPTTSFGLNISLDGFGANRSGRSARRGCRG